MEEKKLRVVKAQEQDYNYVIVSDDEITYNSPLYDCQYNGFGLSHADIGDYSWGEFDFDCDLKDAIKKHFGIECNLDGLCINEDEINSYEKPKYGIHIIKTEYEPNYTKVENKSIKYVTNDEIEANQILDIFRKNQVTPINAEEVIVDLFRKKF